MELLKVENLSFSYPIQGNYVEKQNKNTGMFSKNAVNRKSENKHPGKNYRTRENETDSLKMDSEKSLNTIEKEVDTGKKTLALDHVSFQIEQGEFVVICGESGCGKTTLLRLLKRELAPAGERTGQIYFQGKEQSELTDREAACDIGYVLQNPENQIVTDTVWHELAFGLENMGTPSQIIRRKVAEMACFFGIDDWFRKKTSELSGGQKQLLNLASIMAMQPKILILDEPTSQLDPIAASDFINTLVKINKDLGLTIVMTEHRLEDVFPVADKVAVMDKGKLIIMEPPAEAGKRLKQLNSDHKMLLGLPSAIRIYHGLEAEDVKCPLTVREGRKFLEENFTNEVKRLVKLKNGEVDMDVVNASSVKKSDERKKTSDINHFETADMYQKSGEKDYILENESQKARNKNGISENEKADQGKKIAMRMKNICFRYEKDEPDILESVQMTLYEGEVVSLLGGNGAGKTTLLNVISGANKPYRGKMEIFGKRIQKYKGKELYVRNLASLPQNPQTVFLKMTVRKDYEEIRHVMGYSKEEMQEQIEKIASRLQIQHLLDRHPYDLSGGEQQKAAIGKILLLQPRFLLMDEPTKGTDAWSKKQLSILLKELRSKGITILMVTHDVEFAAEVSDRCGLFFDHEVTSIDTPEEFFCNNNYYTTAANRISRQQYENAVTCDDVIAICKMNHRKKTEVG